MPTMPQSRVNCLKPIRHRRSIPQTVVLPPRDVRNPVLLIDVESDSKFFAHVISDTGAVAAYVVNAVGNFDGDSGSIAIRQAGGTEACDRIERTEHLLRDGAADAGLEVIRLIDVVGVVHVALELHSESGHAEKGVREVAGRRSAFVIGKARRQRLEIAIPDAR